MPNGSELSIDRATTSRARPVAQYEWLLRKSWSKSTFRRARSVLISYSPRRQFESSLSLWERAGVRVLAESISFLLFSSRYYALTLTLSHGREPHSGEISRHSSITK